jgi:predicted RNA-binding Zn-ribbon protein involved in translation (DUF1610 family)
MNRNPITPQPGPWTHRLLVYAFCILFGLLVYWLLKQHREAYEHFLCPACGYPIRRGPLRYLFWTRRSLRRLRLPTQPEAQVDEPYICPACGTVFFEECASCHSVRHALLPTCTKCGATRELETAVRQPAGPP